MTKTKRLPTGWATYRQPNWGDRTADQLNRLPSNKVKILLAAEWAWPVAIACESEAHRVSADYLKAVYDWIETENKKTTKKVQELSRQVASTQHWCVSPEGNITFAVFTIAHYVGQNQPYARKRVGHALAHTAFLLTRRTPFLQAEPRLPIIPLADKHWMYRTFLNAVGPEQAFDPKWRTDNTVALAGTIYHDRRFDLMPVLADALQDAGCDLPKELYRLQTGSDSFTRADWVLTRLLRIGE